MDGRDFMVPSDFPPLQMDVAPQKVPVTLLTGFLGAGKTARLNATLKEGKSRIAVIENEIGALGVDGALVANAHAEADGVIELSNGCLCCSAEVDLVAALEGLVRRHRSGRCLERIIIETTGLADLAPVISLLEDKTDPLAEDLFLDSTVTVVDVSHLLRSSGPCEGPLHSWSSGFGTSASLDMAASMPRAAVPGPGRSAALRTFWRQVAFADQLILSKAEQLGEDEVNHPIQILQKVNPLAEMIVSNDRSIQPLPPPRRTSAPVSAFERLGALPSSWQTIQPAHLEGVECITLRLEGKLFAEDALLRWARGLLQADLEVWRIKGLLQIQGRGLMLLQGAGDQVTLEPWPEAEVHFVVCIGAKGALGAKEQLEVALASCATVMPSLRG
ncbi:unnamed protein product [Durusdinium trenchii]|uniref:CobW C-terminal domain-containing protein n=1 Tax=Durusdinium trenchii TaxID=1381693 RepID=A0ABP0RTK8_9DINO